MIRETTKITSAVYEISSRVDEAYQLETTVKHSHTCNEHLSL